MIQIDILFMYCKIPMFNEHQCHYVLCKVKLNLEYRIYLLLEMSTYV